MPEQNIDLDNVDLTGVDTDRPLLEPSQVSVRIVKIEKAPNKKGTGDNLNIQLALEQMAKSTKGVDIHPGFVMFDLISLVQTDNYNPKERLAQFQEATLGEKKPAFAPLEQYIGKVATVSVGVESDKSGEYPDRNRIKRWVKKA